MEREAAISAALLNNPDYRAATEDSMSAIYAARAAKSDFLPEISLSYSTRNIETEVFTKSNQAVLSAGYNLFRGFRSYAGMRREKFRHLSVAEAERQARLATERDVNIAYQAVLRAEYILTSSQTLLEASELVLAEAEVRQGLDIITRADLYKARADRERAYSRVLDAGMDYTGAILHLSRLMGLNIAEETEFNHERRVYELLPLEDYLERARSGSSAIRISEHNFNVAKASYQASLGSFLPVVDLSASTGWYEEGTREYNSHSIGISATWNLFSGFYDTNMALSAARAVDSSRFNMSSKRADVLQQVQVAWLGAKTGREKVLSAEAYVAAAEESYIATQEMFRLGRATLKETIDERAVLEDAQAALADALYVLVQRHEELAFLTGAH